jgi:precorrin-6B methylase 2
MMRRKTLAVFFALTMLLPCVYAQTGSGTQQYQPTVGQHGKDVIWVPTPEELITAMLDMAKLTPSDYLVDLGSGDGRIVIAAAKRGVRAMGIEFNPDMVELSKHNAEKEGISDKATFVQGDIFATDFSKATVLTMYLLPELNIRLRPKILDMKPGTRVVTHAFDMEDWQSDQTMEADGRTAYFWIVPAKVAGTWTWTAGSGSAELTLKQNYQKIEGSLKLDGKELPLKNVKLDGDQISFSAGEGNPATREYSGRINGDAIEGLSKIANSPDSKWSAHRRADNPI